MTLDELKKLIAIGEDEAVEFKETTGQSIWYPQLEVKMGWFHGTTDREFLDNRHVSGNVFKLMDEAMAFCFKHLNLSAKIGGKLERDEALEVPSAALREAWSMPLRIAITMIHEPCTLPCTRIGWKSRVLVDFRLL